MLPEIKQRVFEKIKQMHSNDEDQLEVIFSNRKRIIVEAPAGYGKTKTMISRIAYLIATDKIPNPKKILALTFSVNAAYKIKKDVAETLPAILSDSPISPLDVKNKVFATNYHGFCRRVLRLYGYLLHPSLARIEYLKGIDDQKAEDLTKLDIGLTMNEAIEISNYNDAVRNIDEEYIENYREYYIEKIKSNFLPNEYITFNAILLLTIELFKKYPNILKFYKTFFPIVIVDEFQDTNILSWNLLTFLIDDETEIIFMGDPLQRIYGFIGAIPDLMQKAVKKFNLYKIELKTNYRFKNNKSLLLLDKNIRENAKNPRSPNIEKTVNITVFSFPNQMEESEGIVFLAKKITEKDSDSKLAVLVKQRGKNTDKILDAFKNLKVPFFYALYSDEDRRYVEFHQKALMEFLRIISNSGDKISKLIFQKFIEKVKNTFRDGKHEIYNSLLTLLKILLSKVFTEFGFLTISEKIALVKDILERRSLKQYLGYVDSKIIISTVHGAKGLEWDYVILPDMEQYSFPNWDGLCGICRFKTDCKIDWDSSHITPGFERKFYEELSVFYVAVTRARKRVYFTSSRKRIHYSGEEKFVNLSCFLKLSGIDLRLISHSLHDNINLG